MVGRVGRDEYGDMLVRAMREDGIGTDGIVRDPMREITTSTAVLVSTTAPHQGHIKFTVQCQVLARRHRTPGTASFCHPLAYLACSEGPAFARASIRAPTSGWATARRRTLCSSCGCRARAAAVSS